MSLRLVEARIWFSALMFSWLATLSVGAQRAADSKQLDADSMILSSPQRLPMSLDRLPASPPRILYSNGWLSITAENSTLGAILSEVHSQTGASVEVVGNASSRVVGQYGPGPVRDVLADLLNGSHFNYVLIGSSTNAAVVDRVILMSASNQPENVSQAGAVLEPAPPIVTIDDGAELPDPDESEGATTAPPTPKPPTP